MMSLEHSTCWTWTLGRASSRLPSCQKWCTPSRCITQIGQEGLSETEAMEGTTQAYLGTGTRAQESRTRSSATPQDFRSSATPLDFRGSATLADVGTVDSDHCSANMCECSHSFAWTLFDLKTSPVHMTFKCRAVA